MIAELCHTTSDIGQCSCGWVGYNLADTLNHNYRPYWIIYFQYKHGIHIQLNGNFKNIILKKGKTRLTFNQYDCANIGNIVLDLYNFSLKGTQ